ncbi:unnamed protein product [Sphenostylis stenocarpa]|uniref:Uncharacterized protein n=1 Tax=Sphenostylis stenocarpa TaxID=92480 RepID=A0AA87B8X5_9FABA|nr:unnamed protein product [Sphenostylis stenocarpa]
MYVVGLGGGIELLRQQDIHKHMQCPVSHQCEKAMDVESAENEVSVSSAILTIASRQNEVLSPEDLAWADSCLVKDSDISETDWVPLENALLEIISSQSQSFSIEEEDGEIPPYPTSSENITVELNQQSSTSDGRRISESSSTYDVNPLRVAVESSADDIPDEETTDTLPSVNPFLPTYNENLKENETIDFVDLDSSSYEMEHLAENIFKIWDIDIPSEEGELVKQLDKALSENSFQTVPSSFNDSGKLMDMNSLDDLVAGIADLSLNENA